MVAGMAAGGGAGTIGLGGEDAVRYLGASVETLPTNCHGKSASGGVECGSWSGSVSFSLRVTTISLYDEGWDGHVRYGGSLPEGLGWGMTVDDVVAKLGDPDSSSTAFQAGVLTYDHAGAGYSRLELYFSPNGKLGRVSVSE